MAAPIKVLIDLNIILDTLLKREPHYMDSARVMAHAERGNIAGLAAAHLWTTLFYLYARDQSAERARVYLTQLLQIISVVPVNQAIIEQALSLPYRDFEDAVQMMAAVHAGADYLLTRNVQDYQTGPLPVLQPVELLALID